MRVLQREEWVPRADAHAARVDALVAEHLDRRRDGVKHPVHDFLFTYYSFRPAQLRRWHPGWGVALADAPEYDGMKGYAVGGFEARSARTSTTDDSARTNNGSVVEVRGAPATSLETQPSGVVVRGAPATSVSEEHVAAQRPLLESVHALLTATAGRAPQLGCFGLHEWAMVHRADETRHDWPLRLGGSGTDAVVESHRIVCSHFDAFRFFTESARPLNTLRPGRDDRAAYEQPACLHGNMDLYKHAFRLTPMVPSELVADCFELARDIRVLDMRASPYDLADLGLEPVRIETPDGKREYAAAQRAFAERAGQLRETLSGYCHDLLVTSRDAPGT